MKLSKRDYLSYKENKQGEKIYHLKKPCQFKVNESIIHQLINNYIPNEEIGGVLWFKPQVLNNKYLFICDKITFVRNSIEDTPHPKGRTKKDTYRADKNELNNTLNQIFNSEYLPIEFHSHPTKGKNPMDDFLKFSEQRETSKQDRKVSEIPYKIKNEKLLMPECLIVVNSFSHNKIFIGFYNGMIAPVSFEETKLEVIQENIENSVDTMMNVKLSENQKLLAISLTLFVLILIVVKRKQSIPILAGLATLLPPLLSSTDDNAKYYNQLSKGDATINIPE